MTARCSQLLNCRVPSGWPVSVEPFSGFHHWIARSFRWLNSKHFSRDGEADSNASLLCWIQLRAGRRFLMPLVENQAEFVPKTAIVLSLEFDRRRCNAWLPGTFVSFGAGLSYPGLFDVLSLGPFGSDMDGSCPTENKFSRRLLAFPAQSLLHGHLQTKPSQMRRQIKMSSFR
jgi:hypothetical protein